MSGDAKRWRWDLDLVAVDHRRDRVCKDDGHQGLSIGGVVVVVVVVGRVAIEGRRRPVWSRWELRLHAGNGLWVPVVMVDERGVPRVPTVAHRVRRIEGILLKNTKRMTVAVDLRAPGVGCARIIRVGNS